MKNLIILLILFFPSLLYSQNLTKESVAIEYFRYPIEPLPEEIKTYNQEINVGYVPSGKSATLVRNNIAKYAEIIGLEKVDGDADVSIVVEYEGFKIRGLESKSETREKKDKDGKVTTYRVYWYNFNYAFPVKLTVVNNVSGDILHEDYVNDSNLFSSIKTNEYSSTGTRSTGYNSKRKSLESEANKRNMNRIKSILRSNYSFAPHTKFMYLRSVKKYKKFDFSEFNENVQLIKLTLEKIQPEEDYITDEVKNDLTLAVNYFENQFSQMDPTSKKKQVNAKIGGVILNNLAVAYFWLGEYEKVEEKIGYAQGTKAKGWISSMKSSLKDRKKRLEVNSLL